MMISLNHATVCFGNGITALNDFTGSFMPGSITALIGGDGAGKTTLLRTLAGQLQVSQGNHCLPQDHFAVGYQPADSGVWSNLSVDENINFVSRVYRQPGSTSKNRINNLLRHSGLENVRDRAAGNLSGGMRQKLGFILATLHQPSVILLDEPTTGVDPVSRNELWTLIAGEAAEGATVVFATTYLDEAERANKLFLMDNGKTLADGSAQDVINSVPGHVWKSSHAGKSPNMPNIQLAIDRSQGLQSQVTWTRGSSSYLWTSDRHSTPPKGYISDSIDLENASIALLMSHEKTQSCSNSLVPDLYDATSFSQTVDDDQHLLEAKQITHRFGKFTALEDVTLNVKPSEIVGLLGGNGAGKTTLMRIILGLETPSAGSRNLFGLTPCLHMRRRIGYLAQGLALAPSLSALDNLRFAVSVHKTELTPKLKSFAAEFGSTPIEDLPLGARRLIAYVAACVHCPELLILDEPTSGMDALTRARLWKNLRTMSQQGVGILITTHYMQEASQCDRLVLLSGGRVRASGKLNDVIAGHQSLVIHSPQWQEAFTLLQNAGVQAILDGRTLRLPNAKQPHVEAVLAAIMDTVYIHTESSTLEEAMMLSAGNTDPR